MNKTSTEAILIAKNCSCNILSSNGSESEDDSLLGYSAV
jgi:hypothetical protein